MADLTDKQIAQLICAPLKAENIANLRNWHGMASVQAALEAALDVEPDQRCRVFFRELNTQKQGTDERGVWSGISYREPALR